MTEGRQWQVAGNAAEVYEGALVPAVFAPWAPLVVALADPRPGERVLDVACGTGVVSRLAAQRVGPTGTVVGLDLNPGMLAVAASTVAGQAPAGAPITWREASATAMPLPDGSFDVVYCQLGLQFFPDRGIFAAALARHVSGEAAGLMRAPFALSDAEELRGLIGAAGFRDVAIRPVQETVRFPSAERFVQDQVAGSPLAGHVAKVSDEARGALAREIGDALRPYLAGPAVAFPIEAHLASATT